MLKTILVPLLISILPFAAMAEPPESRVGRKIVWEGEVAVWKKPACRPGSDCGLPEAMQEPLAAIAEFEAPSAPGAHLVSDQAYVFRNWTATVSLYWVNPELSDSVPPYVVTQIRLAEKVLGVVAECSRYDGVAELRFLPPGSCAGRDGAMLYGVSVMSPRKNGTAPTAGR